MRLQKYITELSMTSDTEISWQRDNWGSRATITIKVPKTVIHKGEKYEITHDVLFYFKILRSTNDRNTLKISFTDYHGNDEVSPKDKGVAVKLFAAIEHIFKTEIPKMPHKRIYFEGDAKHRPVYNMLAKRMKKNKDYRVSTHDSAGFPGKYSFEKIRESLYKKL